MHSDSRKNIIPPAKKSLGQHFLADANIARKIVDLLEVDAQDKVLEIGPGQGALTRWLAELPCAALCAIEKDRHWAFELPRRHTTLSVALADALTMDWNRLGQNPPWKVVGNLPYNVASPMLWDMAASRAFSRGVFMIQKEVARRLAAPPGNKLYGALGVWVQSFCEVKTAFMVGPQVFRPRPKVDSGVVVMVPRKRALAHDSQVLSRFLHLCFQKRRKQLGGILRPLGGHVGNVLESMGLSGKERPEELSVEVFNELAKRLEFGIPA